MLSFYQITLKKDKKMELENRAYKIGYETAKYNLIRSPCIHLQEYMWEKNYFIKFYEGYNKRLTEELNEFISL